MAEFRAGLKWRHWGAALGAAMVLSVGQLGPLGQLGAAHAADLPKSVTGTTAGATWQVTPRGQAGSGSWTLSLRLKQAVPLRAALPQLAVDGEVIGTAQRDADGHTLTLRTSDSRVTHARRVELAWNGVIDGAGSSGSKTPGKYSASAAQQKQSGSVLSDDPAAVGPYRVERADYDLGDTAVRLPGLSGQATELRAAVYLPQGAPGARPVVMLLHGMHAFCYGEKAGTPWDGWPCVKGTKPVPNYLGYGYLAKILASQGYAVVSISADGVNAVLNESAPDAGNGARGELVMEHLDLLKQWNDGTADDETGAKLRGRLDLSDVGLMGHSRGGEGVVAAALLNSERHSPYGIRAVMPLAPTDFGRATLPGVPMAVVLPYCDGDVSDQQGQHYFDDSRYAAKDDVLRTSLMVMGANHNYFNTEWTPTTASTPAQDDWYDSTDRTCGKKAKGRLTTKEQRAVGAAYLAGFFRLNLGGEQQFLPMFDGTSARAASAGRAVVHTEAQQPASARTELARFAAPRTSVITARGASYCSGAVTRLKGQLPPCDDIEPDPSHFPHWTPAYFAPEVPADPVARLRWKTAGKADLVTVKVPAGRTSTARQALTFRAGTAQQSAKTDLRITVTDTSGNRATVSAGAYGDALVPLPRVSGTAKVYLRTVRVPLTAFAGVDTTNIATVGFAPGAAGGDVFLSDLALDTPASVAGGPSGLPAASIGDVSVYEGNKAQKVQIPVTLSKPSAVPVTVDLSISMDDSDPRVKAGRVSLTIPAGRTVASATIAVNGDKKKQQPKIVLHNTLSVPRNAIVGDSWASLTLYDDDSY